MPRRPGRGGVPRPDAGQQADQVHIVAVYVMN